MASFDIFSKVNDKMTNFDIFKGKNVEFAHSNALQIIRQKRKDLSSKEQGFQQFSKKNEKEYMQEMQEKMILVLKTKEKIYNMSDTSHSFKKKNKTDFENLEKIFENREKQIQDHNFIKNKFQKELADSKQKSKKEIFDANLEKLKAKKEYDATTLILFNNQKLLADLELTYKRQYDEILNLQTQLLDVKIKEKKLIQTCCICLNEPSTHACIPCGHWKYCENCIQRISICSICKVKIYLKLRINEK